MDGGGRLPGAALLVDEHDPALPPFVQPAAGQQRF
jgi:hypothetical protein